MFFVLGLYYDGFIRKRAEREENMIKICFIGAGSTIFAKNVLGDIMLTEAIQNAELALYDIDPVRLKESETMLKAINRNCNQERARIVSYQDRKEALRGADYVINAIQVGGYQPSTVIDFEIPKKYGLQQTIGDTLGIGGIFRALRTIPVLLDMARDMQEVCPDTWFLNYSNPMAMLSGAIQRYTDIRTVGLCHSVQTCAGELLKLAGEKEEGIDYQIAGINHMAWLLELKRDGKDIYPAVREKVLAITEPHDDMVRVELMRRFGCFVTESSEHNAEYSPYFIKKSNPELIERFRIPLDEYLRRCEKQIADWEKQRDELVHDTALTHTRSIEYGSYIIEAMETGTPYRFGGNVENKNLITNLPREACVEVPCYADRTGIYPTVIGNLPPQLAALNRTNINVQLLTIEAAVTRRREYIYQAALLDPHTASELTIDEITSLCDDLIEAHGSYLPEYR